MMLRSIRFALACSCVAGAVASCGVTGQDSPTPIDGIAPQSPSTTAPSTPTTVPTTTTTRSTTSATSRPPKSG